MNLHELRQAAADGRATITADEAYPIVGVSRAAFYRSMAAGEVPGVLKLGRKRLLSLPAFLAWIDPTTKDHAGSACHR